jgi:hypothetical protein
MFEVPRHEVRRVISDPRENAESVPLRFVCPTRVIKCCLSERREHGVKRLWIWIGPGCPEPKALE